MSSKAKNVGDKIAQQRITTVVQVLSIMASEAEQMSWFQRFRISQQFLWKKNIDCFFQLASRNRKKEAEHAEVQGSEQKQ